MRKLLPYGMLLLLTGIFACHRKNYESSFFETQTRGHKLIAVMPPEMIYTGKMPQNTTPEQIQLWEENESRQFMLSLNTSIMRYANTSRYYMRVGTLDVTRTLKVLEDNGISVRDSWHADDQQLCEMLGVDAIVRMQIRKKRFMSDAASYTVNVARKILIETGATKRMPIPTDVAKTNELQAYCYLVSHHTTLWNQSYRGNADWNRPSELVIEGITDNFGSTFPYKVRK